MVWRLVENGAFGSWLFLFGLLAACNPLIIDSYGTHLVYLRVGRVLLIRRCLNVLRTDDIVLLRFGIRFNGAHLLLLAKIIVLCHDVRRFILHHLERAQLVAFQ